MSNPRKWQRREYEQVALAAVGKTRTMVLFWARQCRKSTTLGSIGFREMLEYPGRRVIAASASLLLFVVDASDPSFRSQLDVTRKVLGEVGATDVPSLLVLNKRDRLGPDELAALKAEYPDAVILSTRNKDDLQALRERPPQDRLPAAGRHVVRLEGGVPDALALYGGAVKDRLIERQEHV